MVSSIELIWQLSPNFGGNGLRWDDGDFDGDGRVGAAGGCPVQRTSGFGNRSGERDRFSSFCGSSRFWSPAGQSPSHRNVTRPPPRKRRCVSSDRRPAHRRSVHGRAPSGGRTSRSRSARSDGINQSIKTCGRFRALRQSGRADIAPTRAVGSSRANWSSVGALPLAAINDYARPFRTAQTAACVRQMTKILRSRCWTCSLTVSWLRPRAVAIFSFDDPLAIIRRISSSRSVSGVRELI